jgi:L-cysteine desulfidase
MSTIDQVIEQLKEMPEPLQRQVLDYARSLSTQKTKSTSGKDLLQFVGTIPHDDLQLIKEAIEQDCERIDADEW